MSRPLFNCLILSLATFFLCSTFAGESAGAALLQKLNNDTVEVEDKVDALEGFKKSELDAASARALIALIKTCDPALIVPLLELAGPKDEKFSIETIALVVNSGAADPLRAREAIAGVLEVETLSTFQVVEPLCIIYAGLLDQALDTPTLDVLLPATAQAKTLPYVFGSTPFLFKAVFLRMVKHTAPEKRARGFDWLSHGLIAPVLRDEDASTLAEIADGPIPTDAALATALLLRCTHHKIEKGAWSAWLKADGRQLIIDAACAAALDNKLGVPERKFALDQLRQGFLPEKYLDRVAELSKHLATAVDQPFPIRKQALDTMLLTRRMTENANYKVEALKTLSGLLNDADMKLEAFRWMDTLEGALESPEMVSRLLEMMRDKKQDIAFRAYLSSRLARVQKSPEFQRAAVEVLSEAEHAAFIAEAALRHSTGKNLGRNTSAWRAFLNGAYGPQAAVQAELETPVAPLEKLNGFQLTVESIDLDSSIEFNEKHAPKVTRTLNVNAQLKWPEELLVINSSGYVIQEVRFDDGSKMLVDWQKTAMQGTEMAHWWTAFRSEVKGQGDPSRQFQLYLGHPDHAISGIAHLHGYITVKRAKTTKAVQLSSPLQWIGKPLTQPELAKLNLCVAKLSDKSVQLTISRKSGHAQILKSVEFLNGAGEKIKATIARVSDAGDSQQFDLILSAPFPADGSIGFTVFDGSIEERIPFELNNLYLDDTPVKPPAAPEF